MTGIKPISSGSQNSEDNVALGGGKIKSSKDALQFQFYSFLQLEGIEKEMLNDSR